jgi:hypothetical protein
LVLFVNSREQVQNLHCLEGMLDLKSYEFPPEVESAEPGNPANPADTDAEPVHPPEPLPLEIRVEPRPPLSMGIRIGIFIVGWLLILVGVAGLVLPGIQGIATILVGAALLSLDNEFVYRGLRRLLARWPRVWRKLEHFREKSHDWIHRTFHRKT